jgi:hypothetical protein
MLGATDVEDDSANAYERECCVLDPFTCVFCVANDRMFCVVDDRRLYVLGDS